MPAVKSSPSTRLFPKPGVSRTGAELSSLFHSPQLDVTYARLGLDLPAGLSYLNGKIFLEGVYGESEVTVRFQALHRRNSANREGAERPRKTGRPER